MNRSFSLITSLYFHLEFEKDCHRGWGHNIIQYNTMSPSWLSSPMVVSLFQVKLSGWQSVWPQLREVQAITLKSLFQLSLVWSNADHNGGGYDLNWVALCSMARQRKQKPTLNSPSRQPRVAIAPPGIEDEDWKLQTPEWFNMCLDFNGMQILQRYDDRSFQSYNRKVFLNPWATKNKSQPTPHGRLWSESSLQHHLWILTLSGADDVAAEYLDWSQAILLILI